MIYLVTGPDNSGKDTVIKTLQDLLPAPAHVLHYSAITGKDKADILSKSAVMYAQSIDAARYINNMLGADVIFNRFWEGEAIYGPIYRDYTDEEVEYIFSLETLDPSLVKGIYVTANPDTLIAREDGLSQSKRDKVKIVKEVHLFEEFCKRSRYDFSEINTSFTGEEDLAPLVQGIINAAV